MEYRVDARRLWEAEAGGVWRVGTGAGRDFERPKAAVIQLARRTTGHDVPGIQSNPISREGAQSGEAIADGVHGIPLLDSTHLGPQALMDLAKRSCRDMRPPVVGIVHGRRREVALPARGESRSIGIEGAANKLGEHFSCSGVIPGGLEV